MKTTIKKALQIIGGQLNVTEISIKTKYNPLRKETNLEMLVFFNDNTDLIMVNGYQDLDQNNYNSLLTNLIIELNKI